MAGTPWIWPPVREPTSLPPSGAAGGALSGTYPNPTLRYTGNPYIDAPTAPDAFNDEFNSGSPDLAARGYFVTDAAGTTYTRSGDINPWDTTGPPANTYWSTIVQSWIFVQAAPGVQLDISKTIALALGDSYVARMGSPHVVNAAGSGRFNECGFYGVTGTALDNNNRCFSSVRDNNAADYVVIDGGRFTAGVFQGATGKYALGGSLDIRGIHYANGNNYQFFIVGSSSGRAAALAMSGGPVPANLTRFGVRCQFLNTGSVIQPQVWSIDFFRRFPSNQWIAQP